MATIDLNTFKDMAKKIVSRGGTVEDFIEEVNNIKNVPPEVSREFKRKYGRTPYGGQRTKRETAVAFLKENTDMFDKKPVKSLSQSEKDYFSKNKKGIMSILDTDILISVSDAIKEHKNRYHEICDTLSELSKKGDSDSILKQQLKLEKQLKELKG